MTLFTTSQDDKVTLLGVIPVSYTLCLNDEAQHTTKAEVETIPFPQRLKATHFEYSIDGVVS
jgi:hypothetical protein